MELGDLELAVLRAVRTLERATSGAIHQEVQRMRDAAYTSVTTTLYRLVEKGLVAVTRESEKKVYYRIKEGREYRRAMASMIDRLVGTFGSAAVSYVLEQPGNLGPDELERLKAEVERQRLKEQRNG